MGEIYARFLLAALVEVRSAGGILRLRSGGALGDVTQCAFHEGLDEVDGLGHEIRGGVLRTHGDRALGNDGSAVQHFIHLVHSDAHVSFPVQQRPQDGRKSGVLGQETIVDIQCAVLGQAENLGRKPGSPIVGHDDVWCSIAQRLNDVLTHALSDTHLELMFAGELLNGVCPHLLIRVIAGRVRNYQNYFMTSIDDRRQRPVSPRLIAENSNSHAGDVSLGLPM